VANRDREMKANRWLTSMLREKCSDAQLRTLRICWSPPGNEFIEVDLQRDLAGSSFVPLGTVLVPVSAPNVEEERSCFDKGVLEEVARNFPCRKLTKEIE